MAVELRCPDCRAKLRLATAPSAGEEIDCPKCGNSFEAPESEPSNRPARKRRPSEVDEDEKLKSKKSAAPPEKSKAPADKPAGPKKRKARKKKANKGVLIGACIGGLVALVLMVVVLVFLLGRKPPAIALMAHVPSDATYAYGINYAQMQKYVKFYKKFEGIIAAEGELPFSGFEPITTALDTSFNELVDYMIGAGSHAWNSGDVLIIKTQKEFDPGKLAKLKAERTDTRYGTPVYVVNQPARSKVRGAFTGGFSAKIFAPTNRIIVMAPVDTPEKNIQEMLTPPQSGETFVTKAGSLASRIARGNVWWFTMDGQNVNSKGLQDRLNYRGDDPFVLYSGLDAPADTAKRGTSGGNPGVTGLKGYGLRANIRSKSVTFEVALQLADSSQASDIAKKYNDSELAKGDEGETPKTFTEFVQAYFAEKVLSAQILANIGFSSSNDLFLMKSEAEVTKIQEKMPEWSGLLRSSK